MDTPLYRIGILVDGKRVLITYGQWNDLIQESFETAYYVPLGEPIPVFISPLI